MTPGSGAPAAGGRVSYTRIGSIEEFAKSVSAGNHKYFVQLNFDARSYKTIRLSGSKQPRVFHIVNETDGSRRRLTAEEIMRNNNDTFIGVAIERGAFWCEKTREESEDDSSPVCESRQRVQKPEKRRVFRHRSRRKSVGRTKPRSDASAVPGVVVSKGVRQAAAGRKKAGGVGSVASKKAWWSARTSKRKFTVEKNVATPSGGVC